MNRQNLLRFFFFFPREGKLIIIINQSIPIAGIIPKTVGLTSVRGRRRRRQQIDQTTVWRSQKSVLNLMQSNAPSFGI